MKAEVKQVVEPTVGLSCHAWSPERKELAYCPNNNELRICDFSTLKEKFKLTEHDMLISAMDWHPETNFLVTCSHDRNAFVWNYDEEEKVWKPSLVILRIERAALDVKWSPDGQKFAVGSSAKCVPVCYYEKDNNWWVSKMIKKHKSSVMTIDWHPNSQALATGSSDFKARVFSAFISNVDAVQTDDASYGSPVSFGEVYKEFPSSGWIHCVAYSPSGNILSFIGHDSSIHFATFSPGAEPIVQTIRYPHLPLLQIRFQNDATLIGAGHDMNPCRFSCSSSSTTWSFDDFIDKKPSAEAGAAQGTSNDVKSRMAMWQNKDKTGQTGASAASDATSWRKHQAAITCLKSYKSNAFSTTSADGRLVLWNL